MPPSTSTCSRLVLPPPLRWPPSRPAHLRCVWLLCTCWTGLSGILAGGRRLVWATLEIRLQRCVAATTCHVPSRQLSPPPVRTKGYQHPTSSQIRVRLLACQHAHPRSQEPGWLLGLGSVAVLCQLDTVPQCQQGCNINSGASCELRPRRLLLLQARSSPPADGGARCPKLFHVPDSAPFTEDAAPTAAGKRDCTAACLQARAPWPCASTGDPPVHLSPSQAAARDASSAAVGQHPLVAAGVSTASPVQAAAPAADFAGGDSDEAVVAVGNSFSRTAPCLLPEQDQVRKSVSNL